MRVAKGAIDETHFNSRQIAIRFTSETFKRISDAAQKAGRSFNGQVLYYVFLGMDGRD